MLQDYEYFESPSCAYVGMDKCYTYKDFTVYTYTTADGTEHVLYVILTTDAYKTAEGVMLGDEADKVLETYGTDYIESNGSYAYTKGLTRLVFIIKDGRVYSIQYMVVDENV